MGTSVCTTQKEVKYAQISNSGLNCNLPLFDAPIFNEDSGILTCDDIEYPRINQNNAEFIASERLQSGKV